MAILILQSSFYTYTYADENNSDTGGKPKLIFADAGWDSIRIHNEIASVIIENGYGYETDFITGSSPIVIKGLRQGDIDISMESWTDNIMDVYKPGIEKGEILELSTNYDDNAQGLYIPTYVIEGDSERGIEPLAPDLKSIRIFQSIRKYLRTQIIPVKEGYMVLLLIGFLTRYFVLK